MPLWLIFFAQYTVQMHPMWEIRELVDRIVVFLAPHFDHPPWLKGNQDGRSDLCALGRTCRMLQNPALDILWYRQSTLVHLLRCLPPDLWYMQEVEELPWRSPDLISAKQNAQPPAQFVSAASILTLTALKSNLVHDISASARPGPFSSMIGIDSTSMPNACASFG